MAEKRQVRKRKTTEEDILENKEDIKETDTQENPAATENEIHTDGMEEPVQENSKDEQEETEEEDRVSMEPEEETDNALGELLKDAQENEIPEEIDIPENMDFPEEEPEEVVEEEPEANYIIENPKEEELAQTQEEEVSEIEQKIERASKNRKETINLENEEIVSAGKRKKKKLYTEAEKEVIPLDEELQYITEGEERKKAFLSLVESQKAGKVLKGTVTGTSIINGRISAVLKYGEHFRVFIPYDFFVLETETDKKFFASSNYTEEEKEKRRRFLVNQRICSEVDFIIRGIDEANGIAIGDRLSAMSRIEKNWYYNVSRRTKDYIIKEGTKLEARIVFSSNVAMTVEVRGREYRLLPEDISYSRIPDVSEEYPIGTTVPVIFTKVERNGENGEECVTKVSVKEVNHDPRKKYIQMYQIGGLVSAMVTGIDENGIFTRIEDSNGKMDILCNFSDNTHANLPKIGSTVLVKITNKDTKKLYLYGRVIRTLKSA